MGYLNFGFRMSSFLDSVFELLDRFGEVVSFVEKDLRIKFAPCNRQPIGILFNKVIQLAKNVPRLLIVPHIVV